MNVFDDIFFWKGVCWLVIVKFVRVQVQLWVDNGWAVPSRLWRGLPERAMACHEEIGGYCGTCDELVAVLIAGDMKTKLAAILRLPCVCGDVCDVERKDWLKGSARGKDRRVFCSICFCTEWKLDHDWQVDFDAVLHLQTLMPR